MRTVITAAVAALALAAPSVYAQSTQPSTSANTSKTSTSTAAADRTFVMKAAKGGMAEVELGKLAAQKGASDQVKSFGQMMVDDHSKAGDELKSIAQKKNITLPSDIDAKDKALRDRLSKLSGDAFDRAYMRAMLTDHRADVNEFKVESRSGKDPDVKEWAMKTLPTLETHLKHAEDTNRAVGTSGSKPTAAKNPKS